MPHAAARGRGRGRGRGLARGTENDRDVPRASTCPATRTKQVRLFPMFVVNPDSSQSVCGPNNIYHTKHIHSRPLVLLVQHSQTYSIIILLHATVAAATMANRGLFSRSRKDGAVKLIPGQESQGTKTGGQASKNVQEERPKNEQGWPSGPYS